MPTSPPTCQNDLQEVDVQQIYGLIHLKESNTYTFTPRYVPLKTQLPSNTKEPKTLKHAHFITHPLVGDVQEVDD